MGPQHAVLDSGTSQHGLKTIAVPGSASSLLPIVAWTVPSLSLEMGGPPGPQGHVHVSLPRPTTPTSPGAQGSKSFTSAAPELAHWFHISQKGNNPCQATEKS